jgi:hypothetical protein
MVWGGRTRPVEWNGLPCQLAELEVELLDTHARIRTRSLRVVAKLLTQPAPPHLEQSVLLGINFLTDNQLRQELDAITLYLSGSLWVN